jgi:hypothetical protein
MRALTNSMYGFNFKAAFVGPVVPGIAVPMSPGLWTCHRRLKP